MIKTNTLLSYASLALIALLLMGAEGESCIGNPVQRCAIDDDCPSADICVDGTCTAPTACICTEEYAPVCGEDGVTYGNACLAHCAGAAVANHEPCEDDCPPLPCDVYCPWGHVMGDDGCPTCRCVEPPWCETDADCPDGFYCNLEVCRDVCEPDGSRCEGYCGGECIPLDHRCRSNADCPVDEVCRDGTCGPPCDIDCADDAPVCGANGITYPCAAAAHCAGVEVAYPGVCHDVCACPEIYAPVCGVDGRTYSNRCEANCAGVDVAYEGECRDDGCRSNRDCEEGEICYPPTHTCQPPCEVACFAYQPVCGANGQTYGCGEIDAWCHGVEVLHEGECCHSNADCEEGEICYPPTYNCQPPCDVLCFAYQPVCGDDGVTYGCGEIDAWCHGARVLHEGECEDTCACPLVWAPVCGVDGRTYGNRCEAECAGVDVDYDGECLCVCTAHWEPVCGADGVTYGNPCQADCAGVEIVRPGPCECEPVLCDLYCEFGWQLGPDGCPICECRECICPDVWAPVCGVDGRTYGNPCEAECAGVEIAYRGECDCLCIDLWDPVCGVDGVTYGNACRAHCAGVEIAHRGPCECPPLPCDMYCEHGFETGPDGCPICECRECEPLLCDLHCEHGFETGPDGCPICECRECEPLLCDLHCEHGFETGPDGCEICECRRCEPLLCDLYCEHGFETGPDGCEICECRECEPVMCEMYCEYGFETGPDGCPICECRECPPVVCTLACEFGFALGPDGCPICDCADPPKACLSDEECEPGQRCDLSLCLPPPDCEPGRDCTTPCYGGCVGP